MPAPSDADTSAANDRDKQRLLDAAREVEGGERQEREPEPEIEIDDERPPAGEPGDDDGEPGDDGDAEARDEEPRQPRGERRANRYAEAQRNYEEERARRMALEAQIAATRAPPVPQRSREELQAEAEEEYRRNINAIQRERLNLQQVARANQANWTPEIEQRVLDGDVNLRILEANAQRLYASRLDQIDRPPPAPPVNPAIQVVVGRYVDVTKNPLGMKYADIYYMEQKQKGTKLNEVELVEESMKYGRAKMRGEAFSPAARERPKPTKEQKARYTGTGSNSSAGAPAPGDGKRTITENEAKLADRLYPHIEDRAKRRRMYYDNVKMKRA